jgi:tetratricopeptide (TPR) repeat protein
MLRKFAILIGSSPYMLANRVGGLSCRHLVLVLTLLAGAVTATAQTGASRPAGIHDHLRKAAEYLKVNDPNAAVKELGVVLAIDPRNAEAYANLGAIAFYQGDSRKASSYLQKALAIDPSLTKTQALLGICQERLGDPSARAMLEKSFPKLKDKSLRLQVGMALTNLYVQQGNPDRAVPVLQELVDLDPENADILYMAQQMYTELADDTLNKLAIVAPGSARMQQVIAERLVNAGDMPGAVEHYRRALEIDPHVPGVRYELAEAVLESSRNDVAAQAEAEKELGTVVATEGDSAKVQCELAKIALLRSDTQGAHDHYARAFTLNPQDTEAQLGLGRILMTMEKRQEAKKYLELAVQSDPLNGEARYRLAQVYQRLQMPDESEKQMHLFQEIKKAKDQMRMLYRQMKKQTKAEDEDAAGGDQ